MPKTVRRSAKAKRQEVLALRHSTLTQWGNSLGLRIPTEGVQRLGLKAGEAVSVEIGDEAITIRPVQQRRRWTLDALLEGVTPEIVGGEVDWGGPVGKELL
jgi:antitoxin MazE